MKSRACVTTDQVQNSLFSVVRDKSCFYCHRTKVVLFALLSHHLCALH